MNLLHNLDITNFFNTHICFINYRSLKKAVLIPFNTIFKGNCS